MSLQAPSSSSSNYNASAGMMWSSLSRCRLFATILCLSSRVSIGDGLDISLSSDVDVEIPARGIFGASAQDGATLGPFVTSEKISSIVACDIVEILDAPPGYFSGGTTFYSVRDGPVNERSAWSNGKNFLFYIPAHKSFNPTAFGKWLVGPELGVDSAIAYIEPHFDTLSPLFSADSNASGSEWHTISSGSWVTGPIYTACVGTAVRASYYVASYLDRSRQEQRDTIVLGHIDSKDAVAFSKGTYGPYWNSIVKPNMNSFWDSDTKRWLVLTNVRDAIAYGEPMLLVASSPTEEGCIGNLINLEFLYSRFRLMFRCTNVDKEVFSFLGGPGPTATDPEYDRLVADNVEPIHINKHEAEGQFARSLAFIEQAEVDEFLWLWYREESSDNTHGHGSTDESESDLSSHVRLTTDELLVQCVGKSEGRLVLQYYPSDRREILRRSLLSHFTSVIMVDTSGTTPVISLDGKEMDIVSVTSLGLDIEGYLRGYLIRHEGRFGGLSSCYLYHAAIAMPKPLVYAAEVLCVLLGSKPMTMVQYQSAVYEEQWKFPLVSQLCERIILSSLLDPDLGVSYKTFRYKDDTSLIIYRKSREYLVNNLLPHGQAQALHIVPYPDGNLQDRDRALTEQVYNSWWNGYLLGYPERFVDSYCRDLTSELNSTIVESQIEAARRDAIAFLGRNKQQHTEIRYGSDPDVSEDDYLVLDSSVSAESVIEEGGYRGDGGAFVSGPEH